MNEYRYLGHPHQISGVEEVTLARGKGKGMTLLIIRNGRGLEVVLSPDRCLDIARVTFKGDNMGYFSPCGFVAPTYYDKEEKGFLRSFTAGFMTTCGLEAVGAPCTDEGEILPLHGRIGNTPCEDYAYCEDEDAIMVSGRVRDASLFGRSYLLTRTYRISKRDNAFSFSDTVENIGAGRSPCMVLYHINFGYPLLSENARVFIPADSSVPRDDRAAACYDSRLIMEVPQEGYTECCYYYHVKADGHAASVGIYNPDIQKGVRITYDQSALPCLTQWKMMGVREYVLGLEPGNCNPDGRDVIRRKGTLLELDPGETYKTELCIRFAERIEDVSC